MAVRIDAGKARRVLREEAASDGPVPPDWVDLISRLSVACEGAPKTHIAMLGTALLAKSVEQRVDVFALKSSAGTPGAYSARNLAKEALAALAPELGIDLGVSGREPLNNQPYFRPKRITPGMEEIVRGDGLPPFRIVLEGLARLDSGDQDEARAALRAFVRLRRREAPTPLDPDIRIATTPTRIAELVQEYVEVHSEGGRRAQAVAAALLDLVFGADRVQVDRINDPDRRFPGDVGVRSAVPPHSIVRAYEVRDKPVAEHDLHHFVKKAYDHGARRAGVVCVARGQERLDVSAPMDRAFELGLSLRVYFGWPELVEDVLFDGTSPPRSLLAGFGLTVYERLMELEVSSEGLARWRRLTRELESKA